MKNFLLLLLCFAVELCFAQAVITQPNGNVIPNPNLKKLNTGLKVNQVLLKNVSALKLSGKTTAEIVKALKAEKVTAKDAFSAVKTTNTSDAENVGALCFAGFYCSEIVDALKLDGKTPLETIELLKSSTGCSFNKGDILRYVFIAYRIPLQDMVPIIQAKYTTNKGEIVGCLVRIANRTIDIVHIVKDYGFATNCRDLCELFYVNYPLFESYSSANKYRILKSANFNVADKNNDMANAFVYLKEPPVEILQIFKMTDYHPITAENALTLGKVAKYLNISRDDFAKFLRRSPYTAAQILDALQAVYGAS